MAKVKEPLLALYKNMKTLNQMIKEYATVYTIDTSGFIVMKYSGNLSLEKFGILNKKEFPLDPYYCKLINSSQLFQFTKDARVTNIESGSVETSVGSVLGLIDNTHNVRFGLIPAVDSYPHPYSHKEIQQLKMYTKCFHDENMMFDQSIEQLFQEVPAMEEVLPSLQDTGMCEIFFGNEQTSMTLTKEIFPNIKKALSLKMKPVYTSSDRMYILFEEVYEICKIYTLSAILLL